MNVLLTGHTGFIGRRLNAELSRNGHKVYGINSSFSIWDMSALYSFVHTVSPDLIIHCGAISDINKCNDFPEEAYKVNYLGSKNIAEIAAVKRLDLIYFSSDQIYNKYDLTRKTERTIPDPQNYYAKMKLMAEKDIVTSLENFHILRIAWQYTCFDNIPSMGRGGFLENLHQAYIRGNVFLASMNSYRNIAFVYDTIDIVCRIIERKIPYGIYNVSSESYFNIYEMAKIAAEALGCDNTDFILPFKDKTLYNLCADPVSLKTAGYQMPDFEESLYRCCNGHNKV